MSAETESSNEPDGQDKKAVWLVRIALSAFAVCVLAPLVWFGFVAGLPASHDPDDWGMYGDFVGGLSNPLVSAAALILLYLTYRTQRTELKETRQALQDSHKAQVEQAEIARYAAFIHAEAAKIQSVASQRSLRMNDLEQRFSQSSQSYARADPPYIAKHEADLAQLKELENMGIINLNNFTTDLIQLNRAEPAGDAPQSE